MFKMIFSYQIAFKKVRKHLNSEERRATPSFSEAARGQRESITPDGVAALTTPLRPRTRRAVRRFFAKSLHTRILVY